MQAAAVTGTARERTFFGHPRGLATLFFVEMWERFSFYGMASILVLYLTAGASAGGAGLSVSEGTTIYALYIAVIYVVSLPGGWLADRVLGSKRAVLLGGSIIALGHFTMAFGGARGVFAGLCIIVVGTGLLKPNTTSMVGDLYDADDPRRAAGFSLYYMSINLGAFVAPLITGYLAQAVGWHAGFAAAGVGMVLGLAHYVLDWRGLGDVGAKVRRPLSAEERRAHLLWATVGLVASLIVLAIILVGLRVPLTTLGEWVNHALVVLPVVFFGFMLRPGDHSTVERHRLTAMFVLFLATAAWFAVVSQAGSTLNVFAEDDTQRAMWGFTVPAAWFESINPIAILLFAPPIAWLWTRLGTRQPTTPVKFAIALFLVGASMAMMVVAGRYAPISGEATVLVSPLWLLGVYIVQTIGELLISPIGYSVASQLAPPASASQTMGLWFLSLAVGAALSGELANLYGVVGVSTYYGIMGGMMLASGLAILVLTPWLLKMMEGVR